MNSYSLENGRLEGQSFGVEPQIDKVHEDVYYWDELADAEKSEMLNLVRLISGQLKKDIQKAWKAKDILLALSAYRQWEAYVTSTKVIQGGLRSIKQDPRGEVLDYKNEIARDTALVDYLFNRLLKVSHCETPLAATLSYISESTPDAKLSTLARYEADRFFGKKADVIVKSFVNACIANSREGNYTRTGEIACDYYLFSLFAGSEYREVARRWFTEMKMLAPALKGLIRRAFVKRVVRTVWVFYWSNRIAFRVKLDAVLVRKLLDTGI